MTARNLSISYNIAQDALRSDDEYIASLERTVSRQLEQIRELKIELWHLQSSHNDLAYWKKNAIPVLNLLRAYCGSETPEAFKELFRGLLEDEKE